MDSPAFTFAPELRIQVVSVGRDPLQNKVGEEQVNFSLIVPCPEPRLGRQFYMAGCPPEPEPLRKDLWQIEDFFGNMGLELPSRTKAKSMVQTVEKIRGELAKAQFEIEQQKLNRKLEAEKAMQMLDENAAEIERWKTYAIALDADRRARNFAVSRKCAALDPRKQPKS